MNWFALNAVPLINIAGIVLDICGAFLVASEVVHKFHRRQYGDSFTFDSSVQFAPLQTEEYKKWAHLKERKMTIGLFLLTMGFVLQLIANALQIKAAP